MNDNKSQKKKQSLKNYSLGLEVEVFTLDNTGKMVAAADELIRKVKKADPLIDIKKECSKNIVELGSFPSTNVPDTMHTLLNNFETLLHHAEKMDLTIFTLGTYPGKFDPEMRVEKQYQVKRKLFGKKRFEIAGRVIGFHCHHALPWGVFDQKTLTLKWLRESKHKESLINNYNLLIAMDPALLTFMQSSPFYQSKLFGKDSRAIVYRGGKKLNYEEGLYSEYPSFGGLQGYKYTGTDLIHYITNKYDRWMEILKKLGFTLKTLSFYGSILDTNWNPVKVNAHGTLEARGMDINHPLMIVGISTLLKNILSRVQEDFINVVPSDIGFYEPFKYENNTIYIPPDSYVRNTLQYGAAYEGFDNSAILDYCKRLIKLANTLSVKEDIEFFRVFEKMINEKKTVSDEVIAEAKKAGWKTGTELPQEVAEQIALNHSRRLFKEIVLTRKMIE